MKRSHLTTLTGMVVAGALAATLTLAAPAPAQAAATATPVPAAAQQAGPGRGDREARRGGVLVIALVRTTSEETGLSTKEVVEALRGGQSLAQVAAANGSSGESVVQAVTAKAKERLDRLVANGRLSQARADELLERLSDRATEVVNDTELGDTIDERLGKLRARAVTPALVRAASEVSGLPVGDIALRLHDGESLEQIVRSAGGDPAAVIAAATDAFRAAAEAAMSATR